MRAVLVICVISFLARAHTFFFFFGIFLQSFRDWKDLDGWGASASLKLEYFHRHLHIFIVFFFFLTIAWTLVLLQCGCLFNFFFLLVIYISFNTSMHERLHVRTCTRARGWGMSSLSCLRRSQVFLNCLLASKALICKEALLVPPCLPPSLSLSPSLPQFILSFSFVRPPLSFLPFCTNASVLSSPIRIFLLLSSAVVFFLHGRLLSLTFPKTPRL